MIGFVALYTLAFKYICVAIAALGIGGIFVTIVSLPLILFTLATWHITRAFAIVTMALNQRSGSVQPPIIQQSSTPIKFEYLQPTE
jgi:ribose/xylose/arabinose/galactoside ABC-type transport system permease subunit